MVSLQLNRFYGKELSGLWEPVGVRVGDGFVYVCGVWVGILPYGNVHGAVG